MHGSEAAAIGALLPALALTSACGPTVDLIGFNDGAGGQPTELGLKPLSCPAAYPNAFQEALGKDDDEVRAKIDTAFEQLFHGDGESETFYFPDGDEAYIKDIHHDDIRTEGLSLGMNIAVQLGKQDEFDRLYRYARAHHQYKGGVNEGYFRSYCDTGEEGATDSCIDPYGLQQFAMALLLAEQRWGADSGDIDYAVEVLVLFEAMREKESNQTFDDDTQLVFDEPRASAVDFTRPALVMPAYYQLWAQATDDPFWSEAASSARDFWKRVAHPSTGLMPVRAYFDGTPVADWDQYEAEGYRAQLNLVLDEIWTDGNPWNVEQSNRLLRFFADQGIEDYRGEYTLDGNPTLEEARDDSLVVINGVTALIADIDERDAFIQAVWDLPVPSGSLRYYAGIFYLIGLMVLSGQYQVCPGAGA